MSVLTKIDDPRFLTVAVASLFAAALWLATWSVMGSMDMGAMKMEGMSMPAASESPMAGMNMTGEGMTDAGLTGTGMTDAGMTGAGMSTQSMEGSGMAGTDMNALPEPAGGGMAMDSPMSGTMTEDMSATTGGMEGMGGMSGMDQMNGMDGMDMFGMSMDPTDWSLRTIAETSALWLLMMAAMMLPAMAPVMSVYAGISAKEDEGARLALRITLFTLSYFLLWAAFSIAAALLQMVWRGSDYFTMGGTQATPIAAAVLLMIAGAYQFTPLKDACLKHCRHPLQYLLAHWKPGLAGAFPVGARHGLYCFGCCVAFMGLMFVFGAMNVWWMAVIAFYFLAEKILPKAEIWGKVTGAGLIAAGGYLLATSV